MAAQVSYEQRLEVRTALREAGVNQETVDEIDDGDIDKLYSNNWKRKGLLLSAQRDALLLDGVSRGAAHPFKRPFSAPCCYSVNILVSPLHHLRPFNS